MSPVACPFHFERAASIAVTRFCRALETVGAVPAARITVAPLTTDPLLPVAAFFDDRIIRIDGDRLALWDAVSGDYAVPWRSGAVGWIRLHANFSVHRRAVYTVLELGQDPSAVSAEETKRKVSLAIRSVADSAVALNAFADRLAAVGGCSSVMRSMQEWHADPLYKAVAESPLIHIGLLSSKASAAPNPHIWQPNGHSGLPLSGLKVLDLTRVLAGPTCCKILAAHGAQVLHVSSDNLDALGPLDIGTSVGKRSCYLDLKTEEGKGKLIDLVKEAHVFVQAYRPGALESLGLGPDELSAINPGLVYASISAYGVPGSEDASIPQTRSRGFDSLVQMYTGICHESMVFNNADKPCPLPCQALDYAAGWLAASGILEALQATREDARGRVVEVSLVRTSVWLESLGRKTHEDAEADSQRLAQYIAGAESEGSPLMEEVTIRHGDLQGDHPRVLRKLRHIIAAEYADASKPEAGICGPPARLGIDAAAFVA
ncbi:hypothetical protein HDU82_007271 [Entophlyctis luteolus]|nr:hypothetical protein HDU82_007271 [Entophlyctis luteolus]